MKMTKLVFNVFIRDNKCSGYPNSAIIWHITYTVCYRAFLRRAVSFVPPKNLLTIINLSWINFS